MRSCLIILFIINTAFAQNENFVQLNTDSKWQLKFSDNCTEDWETKWFLDGLRAQVVNTQKGMLFSAGDVEHDHSCHAVLWTKPSFSGDVKIEYDYTKIDTRVSQVNIVYIQAQGIHEGKKDIFTWKDERDIPYMRTYFDNMKCLHISYAAFGNDGEYIRARQYPRLEGTDFNTTTEIPPASFNTGLFIPGKKYKITIIKTKTKLFFRVKGDSKEKVFSWDLDEQNQVKNGRIGLRHMFTRSSLYSNFKVYTKL
ncbi:DUF1961 family protein [Seonamhaeicola marinus]|uniref:DUF1961 family protein n=1 Tax=Seonamhaeicola marinus TaxID=1912246 RepID=UPI001CA345CB|nr:DUF1961 family protein [Seonamhaeicola marinus]